MLKKTHTHTVFLHPTLYEPWGIQNSNFWGTYLFCLKTKLKHMRSTKAKENLLVRNKLTTKTFEIKSIRDYLKNLHPMEISWFTAVKPLFDFQLCQHALFSKFLYCPWHVTYQVFNNYLYIYRQDDQYAWDKNNIWQLMLHHLYRHVHVNDVSGVGRLITKPRPLLVPSGHALKHLKTTLQDIWQERSMLMYGISSTITQPYCSDELYGLNLLECK